MAFDLFTLITTSALVATILSLVAFLAWLAQGKGALLVPLAWAFLLTALSVMVRGLQDIVTEQVAIVAGNALGLLAYGLLWKAVCGFGRRRAPALAVGAGAILWIEACLFPPFYASVAVRIVASSIGLAVYTLLTVSELWAGRGEPLRSRWAAIAVGIFHALFLLFRVVFVADLPFPFGAAPQNLSWSAVLAFEGLIYGTMTMCSLLLMDRERAELEQRQAADLDPLTGVPNRRAFQTAVMSILAGRAQGELVAVLLFDLDHFKRINDTFGHAVGDEILVRFALTANRVLGNRSGFGRLGGEEFAGVFICGGRQEACAVAEHVRTAFAEAASTLDGRRFESTVSIGVSMVRGDTSFEATLAAADRACYEAKRRGRDRVVYQEVIPPVSAVAPSGVVRFPGAR
jgi:diguanylate cyclase (GGDEF)-like protein